MLTERDIQTELYSTYKTKKILCWAFVRIVSTFGPILATYIFARGVGAIETRQPLETVIIIFLILLLAESIEHLLRILSKRKIAYYSESILITVQEELIARINPKEKHREVAIQTLRNLTQAVRSFVEFMYNNGFQAIISFISIPLILLFIDRRIFYLEVFLIAVYLGFTMFFSGIYEKRFEGYDEAREKYFSKLLLKNNVVMQAKIVMQRFKSIQNITLVDWVTLQNLISLFHFIMIYFIVLDIYDGTKQISDLVLIIGYVRETKQFLNHTTSFANHFMEIKAGIERVSAISRLSGLVVSKSTKPVKLLRSV